MICDGLSREKSNKLYLEVLEDNDLKAAKQLCKEDLFFLLTIGCKRKDIDRDWLYDRCREVEASPDGHLDLWAREHYKSTIITFGKSIQDLLVNPDITIGILSHTRPIAKGFLDQIKREFELNVWLKELFSDILYQKPEAESPKWSLDNGIIIKRNSNPKESSIEAWGLVDGQPTSKHFNILVYDDIVTRESVTTAEQIKKVTDAWGLSTNLGAMGGKKRYIGTRYHIHDTYSEMMKRGAVEKRIYPATDDGKETGNPVLLSREDLMEKRKAMGPYIFGAQLLQNAVADKAMSFRREWLKFYDKLGDIRKWNKYIIVDPASKKKPTSDYTVMEVIGLAPDENYYLLDGFRDRLNLTQRAKKLFELHRKWMPLSVGYEQYGMQADIEHIQYVMEEQNYRFNIVELGGQIPKEDRIKKMVPIYEQARMWMPKTLSFIDYEGVSRDYIRLFVDEEYVAFPVCAHDDMMDTRARIIDPAFNAKFPKIVKTEETIKYRSMGYKDGWMD